MKTSTLATTIATLLVTASAAWAWPIHEDERKEQNENFTHWWDTDLVWKFDELPTEGSIPQFRYPYSGAIYPDNAGGTANVLRKYDRAFHQGRNLAESFEYHDISIHRQTTTVHTRGGLFGMMSIPRTRTMTPYWAGHCNGWAAATIRHAEPVKSVTRNGVEFTPSDIKGLLAELYVYSRIAHLGGVDSAINPATLHVVLGNWVGRQKYPIAMDSTVGKEIWNYPIYAYRSSNAKRGSEQVEVKTNLGYVYYTDREYDKGPKHYRYLHFHYMLELDEEGKITGGYYFNDSSRLDMLWLPLLPTPGGEEGNESGNPHLDAKHVLALWRDSAPQDLREKWYTVDPAEEDRVEWKPPTEEEVVDGETGETAEETADGDAVTADASDQAHGPLTTDVARTPQD